MEQVDDSEELGGVLDGMRALFEMNLPETVKVERFKVGSGDNKLDSDEILVAVKCSDFDNPGALQSGKFIWPASTSLCKFLCKEFPGKRDEWREMNAVEMGCGAGLVGILATKMFRKVVFTDRDQFLLNMVQESLKLETNQEGLVASEIDMVALSWGNDEDLQCLKNEKFDMILGADLTYSTEVILLLMNTISKLLSPTGTYYLCSSFRHPDSTRIIEEECAKYGLVRKEIPFEDAFLLEQFNFLNTNRNNDNDSTAYSEWSSSRMLRDLAKKINHQEFNLLSRIRSIHEDSRFVTQICKTFFEGLPIYANLRNGAWYVDPKDKAGECYFRSADGHHGVYNLSTRQLNLEFLRAVVVKRDNSIAFGLPNDPETETRCVGGAVVVDSTRRGKRFPDSFNRTIPIWCYVMNCIAFGEKEEYLALPSWVPEREIQDIVKRVHGELLNRVKDEARTIIKDLLHSPLYPIWVCSDVNLKKEDRDDYLNCRSPFEEIPVEAKINGKTFIPIVCFSASVRRPGGDPDRMFRSWKYIQGAGDDEENWTNNGKLLTPIKFWGNIDQLVGCNTNNELLEFLAHHALQLRPNASTKFVRQSAADGFVFCESVAAKQESWGRMIQVVAIDDDDDRILIDDRLVITMPKSKHDRRFWQEQLLPMVRQCHTSNRNTGKLTPILIHLERANHIEQTIAIWMICNQNEKKFEKKDIDAALIKIQGMLPNANVAPPRRMLKELIVHFFDNLLH